MPFGFPGSWEWILILVVALLVFGKRLPEVMRSAGRSIVELKKGFKDMEDEIERESSLPYHDQETVKDEFYEESEDQSGIDDGDVSADEGAEMETQEEDRETGSGEEAKSSEESENANTPSHTSPEDGKVSV